MVSRTEKIVTHLYLIPAAVFLLVFVFYPLVANVGFSFERFTLGAPTKEWVGLANYRQMLHDPIILTALKNNLLYAVISIVFQVAIAHMLAATVLTVLPKRLATAARSFYFIPVLLSITVVGILFTFIYDSENGLLNVILQHIGLGSWAKPWLGDSSTAIFAVISVSQWQSVGYTMLLFIVSMQGINRDFYEAAALDGAGTLKQYLHVTVPQTREMIFVVMILTVSGAFTVFSEPYIMTNGGPGNASQTLATYLYNQGFFQNQMGYAATISTLIMVITIILSIVQSAGFRTGKE